MRDEGEDAFLENRNRDCVAGARCAVSGRNKGPGVKASKPQKLSSPTTRVGGWGSMERKQDSIFIFWPGHFICGILVSPPGIEPAPPALEARSLNHWIPREVLKTCFTNRFLQYPLAVFDGNPTS